MPLKGGAADKYGGRYEGLWTVSCMTDVMAERADSMRLEPPGEEGKGVEFWIRKDGVVEYHQVKRQRGRGGNWTLSALDAEAVLTTFFEKLTDPNARCVFVSADSASELGELAERARDAGSWADFDRHFLGAEEWRQRFGGLRKRWGDPEPEEAWDKLRRICVRTLDEESLRSYAEVRLESLVEGDASSVADALAASALENVHRKLRAYDIWARLEERGHGRRDWANDPRVLANVDGQNGRYLDGLREELVGGAAIPRQEAYEALDLLVGEGAGGTRGVLLAGEAGVGKSGVVLQTVEGLRERGVPFLAFRVDRLRPTTLPEGIGEQIGMPGSPASVLAAIAREGEGVLIIDQLDAVSLVSGRNPELFEVIRDVIRQADNYPEMRLLLACRRIDLENDHRLRSLVRKDGVATALDVGRLPEETVRGAVSGMGLNGQALGPGQVRLLSVPLHLRLLEEISDTTSGSGLEFRTADDLYDEFWRRKRQLVRARLGGAAVRWTQVMDTLCDRMSEDQVLSAPDDTLTGYEDEANAMTSEHVLVLDRGRYAFFHEGFFDYAFARRFAERGRELLPLLRESEQHLFRRAQVRQILRRTRDRDRERYLADLSGVLHGSDMRFHIKQVVFTFLGGLDEPTSEEWDVLAPLLEEAGTAREREVWGILRSAAWFRVVDSLGLWERWLREGDEDRRDRVVAAIYVAQKEEPDRVAELLEPYFESGDPAWRRRFVYLLRGAGFRSGRGFFDLFLRAIDGGLFDDAEFQLLVYGLAEENPEWCSEALAHFLKRRLDLSIAAGEPNPFYDSSYEAGFGRWTRSHYDERVFLGSARGAPEEFASQLLPFVLALAQGLMEKEGDPPWRDPVWQTRNHDEQHFTHEVLLAAMVEALRELAANLPESFEPFAQFLHESDAEVAQYLLVRAYGANGERFADEAVEYLLERPMRLETGYAESPHWATRELLEAATPHCSEENLKKLENLLLGYYSRWERSTNRQDWHGEAQLTLLDAVATTRRSEDADRRVKDLREKFGEGPILPPPPTSGGGVVESPIPEGDAARMSDEEWLEAVARYKKESGDEFLVGGAHQLSGVLEGLAKDDPERFVRLALRFPNDTHRYYFDSVLRAAGDIGVGTEILLELCRKCHGLPDRPCGRWLCGAVAKAAERDLPMELLEMVAWYATEDPDPERETWREEGWDGTPYYGGDPFSAGMNATRGQAALAAGDLLVPRGARVDAFRSTLERLVEDPSVAVRSCVARALLATLIHDRDLAVGLFVRLCDAENDALLGTDFVERFLRYATATHFAELEPILKRMLASKDRDAVAAGARQACVAALEIDEARPLAQACLDGDEIGRAAAAEVFATNLRTARYRSVCEEGLTALFDDNDEEVRRQAARCFFAFRDGELGGYDELIRAFLDSRAFDAERADLLYALQRTNASLPETSCLACERFLDVEGEDAANIQLRAAGDTDTVLQILVRTYNQGRDAALWARCLDLFDRMAELGVYGTIGTLERYER